MSNHAGLNVLDRRSKSEQDVDERINAHIESARDRIDLLNRTQDGDCRVRPKVPLPDTVTLHWPPEQYDNPLLVFRPPKVDITAPFHVVSNPSLAHDAYEKALVANRDLLRKPLSDSFKRDWATGESLRLGRFANYSSEWDKDQAVEIIDQIIYSPILESFGDIIGADAWITPLYGDEDPLSISVIDRDNVVIAPGRSESLTKGCVLVRFLQMSGYLDVCEDIQELAQEKLSFKPGGQWTGSKGQEETPLRGRARSILQWVFHATRPGKGILDGGCKYIKLGDGWNTIWFYVHDGIMEVGPTMTPYLSDDPGTNVPLGLVHAFLAFTVAAGAERSQALAEEEMQKTSSSREENIRVPDEAVVTSSATQEEVPQPRLDSAEAHVPEPQAIKKKPKSRKKSKIKAAIAKSPAKPRTKRAKTATVSASSRQS